MAGFVERVSQGTIAVGGINVGGSDITAVDAAKLDAMAATAYPVVCEAVTLTQTSGSGTYTGSVVVPAGGIVLDVGAQALALWTGSSASLIVGDVANDDGFFEATDLTATDLLVGETNNIEHPGGKAGAYIASEQRVLYSATARTITFKVTQTGTGTAGRTVGYVKYAVPTAVAATKA